MEVNSTRGKAKIVDNSFVYQFDKYSKDGSLKFWKCERREICKSRLHTDSATGDVIKRPAEHSHAPDRAHIEVLQQLEAMKERAVNSQDTTRQVVESVTRNLSMAAKGSDAF